MALAFVGWAGWMDWRSRRIRNWLTLPGLVVGVGLNALMGGWQGARAALLGAALMLLLLLPLVWLRALGAGDWKLMGALGAILGPKQALTVLVASIFLGGLMAIVQVVRQRRLGATVANIGRLVQGFFIFGLRAHPVINLDNPQMARLPFGVAVAGATLLCYAAGYALGSF